MGSNLTDEFNRLYCQYRAAKARYEAEMYVAAENGNDMPEDREHLLGDAHTKALDAILHRPASTVHELWRKLEIVGAEGIYEGYVNAKTVTALLETDAKRLAFAK